MYKDKYVNDIVDRYIYDVTRRLKEEQRADIDRELRTLIDDMLEDKAENPSKEDIDKVLTELGKPSNLASKYRDTKMYVIGPALYDTYILVLKIVMAVSAFGVSIALVIDLIANPINAVEMFAKFIGGIVSALIQSFGFVTLAFFITERVNSDKLPLKTEWKVSDLLKIPENTSKIKRSEPIVGIIFTVIFIIALNLGYKFLGIYIVTDKLYIIPVFDIDVFRSYLILIDIFLGLSAVKEFGKFITGRYTPALCGLIIVVNVVSLILVFFIFTNNNIWNPNLVNELNNISGYNAPENIDKLYDGLRKFFTLIFIIPILIDTVVTSIKTFNIKK